MERKERFEQAYKHLCYEGHAHTQRDIAEKMGASESNVSKALKGNPIVLTDRFLKRFNLAYNKIFSENWLLYGEGEMLTSHVEQTNVNGDNNAFSTVNKADDKLLAELANARQQTAKAQEQIDRLISIIEKMQNNH